MPGVRAVVAIVAAASASAPGIDLSRRAGKITGGITAVSASAVSARTGGFGSALIAESAAPASGKKAVVADRRTKIDARIESIPAIASIEPAANVSALSGCCCTASAPGSRKAVSIAALKAMARSSIAAGSIITCASAGAAGETVVCPPLASAAPADGGSAQCGAVSAVRAIPPGSGNSARADHNRVGSDFFGERISETMEQTARASAAADPGASSSAACDNQNLDGQV